MRVEDAISLSFKEAINLLSYINHHSSSHVDKSAIYKALFHIASLHMQNRDADALKSILISKETIEGALRTCKTIDSESVEYKTFLEPVYYKIKLHSLNTAIDGELYGIINNR